MRRSWAQVVNARIETLRVHAEHLDAARAYLERLLEHHPGTPPDGCPHFETLIFEPVNRVDGFSRGEES
jgi:hypothetical protein